MDARAEGAFEGESFLIFDQGCGDVGSVWHLGDPGWRLAGTRSVRACSFCRSVSTTGNGMPVQWSESCGVHCTVYTSRPMFIFSFLFLNEPFFSHRHKVRLHIKRDENPNFPIFLVSRRLQRVQIEAGIYSFYLHMLTDNFFFLQ